ncbi:methyltransferase family protein [Flavobacterium limnosediminis JC2902]|uniref:Methyltransferase family protein n=1 Tax=Flavobacterium limnosediminis JC2902 TaxID=1341181 RepID=V6SGY2_9FLAO|nr:methyltransferase domain-containing protein [Flavobacterium limnosediminis]ESU25841.1 methyltransferase family protein [Flavobacterium limnosediminis JC2902]
MTLLSFGDFIDFYHKLKNKGAAFLFSKLFKFSFNERVSSKWDAFESVSDFWVIPEIVKSWNHKISGNEDVIYEEYVTDKYFRNANGLRLLSVGCGEGLHERNFGKSGKFDTIVGVDISPESIANARKKAVEANLKIDYFSGDFRKIEFGDQKFDVVVFNSSLHHFENIPSFLSDCINPLLSENGKVVVFEYCGPNRLQWRTSQLEESNRILKILPSRYKMRIDRKSIKKKVYRPGLLRMLMVDPSEAPDSENLRKGLISNFDELEETELGWNITHLLLKDIAHNFLNDDKETKNLLREIIQKEADFVAINKENDAIFGVYQKRKS